MAPQSGSNPVGKRSREYLTDREVERVIEAAKQNRSGHRDATAILVAYRHGDVLIYVKWEQGREVIAHAAAAAWCEGVGRTGSNF